jgi:membrane protease YdiL (CAAX protease family)
MNLFANATPHAPSWEMGPLPYVVFILYALISFIRVATYAGDQIQAGRLLNRANAPLPLVTSPLVGWLFVVMVLQLLFLQSVFYMLVVVMGVGLFLIDNGRTAREQFGLARLPIGSLVRWALLICGAVVFVEVPLSQLVEWVMTAIHIPHPEQQSVETFKQFSRASDICNFLLWAVIISPMMEEIFFRGFLLTFLKNHTTTWLALILSAGIFAFAHVNLGSVVQLWLLGIVLGVAYEHTGALLLPIGVHACFNLITAMSLLLEKGGS